MYPWDNEIPTAQYQWEILARCLLYEIGTVTSVEVHYQPMTHTQDISVIFKRTPTGPIETFAFNAPIDGPGREVFEQLNARIKLELSE